MSILRFSAVAALCGGVLLLAACDGPTPPEPPEPVASITMSPDTATLPWGASMQISADVRGADGEVLQGRQVTWSSSDEAVASVTTGLVLARTPGTALITATSEGKSAQARITVPYEPPTLSIMEINGAPVFPGGTTETNDSVAATVRVDVSPLGRPIESLALLGRLADGTVDTLARSAAMNLAPGTSTTVTLHSRSAPSGRYHVFVQAQAVESYASPPAAVEVRRPFSKIRLLSINGQAVQEGATMAVADSFRVTLAVVVADTASSRSIPALRRAHPEFRHSFIHLGMVRDSLPPGTTAHITFTAYGAPGGTYTVWPAANVSRSNHTQAVGAPVTVQVSQSDVTPPVLSITSPVQGATVATRDLDVTFSASDARGVWFFGHSVEGGCSMTAMLPTGGPHTTATYAGNQKVCGLREGENRITIWTRDTAWNLSSQTVVVTYAPAPASTRTPAAAPSASGADAARGDADDRVEVRRVEHGHDPEAW